MKNVERFTIVMYDKLGAFTSINKARIEIFCKSTNIVITRLRPTQVWYNNRISVLALE